MPFGTLRIAKPLCSIKMNNLTNILIGFLILSSYSLFGQLGRAVISYQPIYEEENNFFPHDHFLTVDMDGLLDTAVFIQKIEQGMEIKNIYNDGFTGHSIEFQITPSLEIENVNYREWTDVIDGSEIKFHVEKAILSMNENPFDHNLIVGHYSLQIRRDYFAGELLTPEGVGDTTSYEVFHGKFKIYSDLEKKKGRDWIIDQHEIRMGIKDTLGIYEFPDEIAEYKFGLDSLKVLLQQFEIDRSETKEKRKAFITLKMVIDEYGQVDPATMTILEPMKSTDLIESLRMNQDLKTNWKPATHNGKPVKSKENVAIRIRE